MILSSIFLIVLMAIEQIGGDLKTSRKVVAGVLNAIAGVPPYHTIPYHTIPYHTTSYHTTSYHTIPYHIIPYHTIPHHTIPCHGIERNCDQNQSNLENRRGDYDDGVDYTNTIIVTNITIIINTILICNCRFMEPLRTWFRIINCMLPLHLERKLPKIET